MDQSVRYVEGIAIIDIEGEIIGNMRFDSELFINIVVNDNKPKPTKGIILNLAKVLRVDNLWLGILFAKHKELQRNSMKLVLLDTGRSVQYSLLDANIDVFEKYWDEGEAIASFGKK